jgi:hypothetical protein
MTNRKESPGFISGDQRTSIRMSKLARILQSNAATSNWNSMAKMLFRADHHQGRQEPIRRFIAESRSSGPGSANASYGTDQFQYILILMLIISVAEKRTQELYRDVFAERCDAIGLDHKLQDDQYWKDGMVPAEWEALNADFEQRSLQILLRTLREYHQDEIADLVQADGLDQLFSIMTSVRVQFLKVLENSAATENGIETRTGSIPETLQSSAHIPKA